MSEPPFRPRALLLDAFGTIFESRGLARLAAEEIARAVGCSEPGRLHDAWWEASAAEDWPGSPYRTTRRHLATSLATAFRRLDLSAGEEEAERGAAVQLELLRAAPLAPGAAEALARLGRKFRLALVTNADEEVIRPLLARHGLDRTFAHVQTSEAARAYKPAPQLFAAAVAALALPPGEVLVVGDSYADDVRGADAAGLAAAWLNRAHEPPPADGPRPTLTVGSLEELCQRLGA